MVENFFLKRECVERESESESEIYSESEWKVSVSVRERERERSIHSAHACHACMHACCKQRLKRESATNSACVKCPVA